jgi:D-sedoheptulose 7-phosphate isomerase
MADAARSAGTGFTGEVLEFLESRCRRLPDVLGRLEQQAETVARIADLMLVSLRDGKKILVAGNGGSAAEAQHFAAELVGRFKRDRLPYPALSLTTDTSILTALANDYSYDDVFARQVTALAQPGDVFLAYSTSGESENLVRAAEAARQRGARVVSLTGSRANRLEDASDLTIHVPSEDTAIVQEIHLMVTHLVCGIVESELAGKRETLG